MRQGGQGVYDLLRREAERLGQGSSVLGAVLIVLGPLRGLELGQRSLDLGNVHAERARDARRLGIEILARTLPLRGVLSVLGLGERLTGLGGIHAQRRGQRLRLLGLVVATALGAVTGTARAARAAYLFHRRPQGRLGHAQLLRQGAEIGATRAWRADLEAARLRGYI